MTHRIFIHDMEQQTDGRWTIIFTAQDGKRKVLHNAAFCCNATITQTDDSVFTEIYFETVRGFGDEELGNVAT